MPHPNATATDKTDPLDDLENRDFVCFRHCYAFPPFAKRVRGCVAVEVSVSRAMDEIVRVLKVAAVDCAGDSVVYAHRTVPQCYLGRDLSGWLVRADRAILSSVVNSTSGSMSRREGSKATKLAEAINLFLQRCVDLKFLVGINREEKVFLGDCFYVMRLEEDARGVPDKEVDRKLLDLVELLKRRVEVRDRRNGFRSVRSFVASEARAVLNADAPLFEALAQENLICACVAGNVDLFQFVPRVVHSGFLHVGSVGNTLAKRWVLLREKSLIVFGENRKQVLFEVELAMATCEPDFSTNDDFRFVVTTTNERIVMMTHSLCERNVWLKLVAPLNTIVAEENELINQAEAIITSTSFFVNSQ